MTPGSFTTGHLNQLAALDWEIANAVNFMCGKERESEENKSQKIENGNNLHRETIEKINAWIASDVALLNDQQTVDALLQIDYQAERIGVDVKALRQLILKAPSASLDYVAIERVKENGMALSKHFPRLFLALRSSYFNDLIQGPFKESKLNQLSLKEDKEGAFVGMLEFLETGDTLIDGDNAVDLFEIADKYDLPALKRRCGQWIIDNLPEEEFETFLASIAHQSSSLLKDHLVNQLFISCLKNIKNDHLASLCSFLKNYGPCLTKIDLNLITTVSARQVFPMILSYKPRLAELSLAGVWVNKEIIKQIGDNFKQLTCLELFNCDQPDACSFNQLFSQIKSLKTLNLNCCNQVTDEVAGHIAHCYPNLDTLSLPCSRLTDKAIIEIAERIPNLKNLYLANCEFLTDDSIIAIANRLHHLKTLYLACGSFTNRSIEEIARHLPQLTELYLYVCHKFTDLSMNKIARNLNQLTTFSLSNNRSIESIDEIDKLTQLKNLSFKNCHFLNDAFFKKIGQLKQLTSLNLAHCSQLSEDTISELVVELPLLATLDISCDFRREKSIADFSELASNPHLIITG